jgi:shikimate kinase
MTMDEQPETDDRSSTGVRQRKRTRRTRGVSDVESSRHLHIVLMGLMGAGKSSVGRRLANELGRPLVDSDSLVQLRSGQSPRELAASLGLSALHRLETAEANRVLNTRDSVVFASAASLVDALEPPRGLGVAWVVWLDASPPVLRARTIVDDRPHLDDELSSDGSDHRHQERSERGRSLADFVIDTDGRSVKEVAALICDGWRRHQQRIAMSPERTEPQ